MPKTIIAQSDRQRQAWHLRHELGWSLKRIGGKLGVSQSAASRLIARARIEAGLIRRRVPTPQRRIIRSISLSSIYLP